jgi:hypothetical protein
MPIGIGSRGWRLINTERAKRRAHCGVRHASLEEFNNGENGSGDTQAQSADCCIGRQ